MRVAPLVVAAAVLAAACARGPKFPPPPRDPSIPDPATLDSVPARAATLHVESRNSADITIFITRGAVRNRLGTVTASSARDFVIPASYVNDAGGFRLVADPVGARGTLTTERIIVRSGGRVIWTLESTLSRSSVAVY